MLRPSNITGWRDPVLLKIFKESCEEVGVKSEIAEHVFNDMWKSLFDHMSSQEFLPVTIPGFGRFRVSLSLVKRNILYKKRLKINSGISRTQHISTEIDNILRLERRLPKLEAEALWAKSKDYKKVLVQDQEFLRLINQ